MLPAATLPNSWRVEQAVAVFQAPEESFRAAAHGFGQAHALEHVDPDALDVPGVAGAHGAVDVQDVVHDAADFFTFRPSI